MQPSPAPPSAPAGVVGAASRDRLPHTRGVWVTGRFDPSPEAAALGTAALLTGAEVPVVARFSSMLGGRDGHDGAPGEQGLAVRFHAGDGGEMDLLAGTLPVFFVRTGADMLEYLRAVRSPDPAAVAAFLERHPEAATATALAETARPAESFTGVAYHAVHTFGLVDAAGRTRWARLSWQPERPLPALTPDAALARPADYLTADLPHRLPARFRLTAQLPCPDDAPVLHDPTRLWSQEPARTAVLGTLVLDAVYVPPRGCEPRFDGGRVPEGFVAPRVGVAGWG
ncbi:catalase [Streptomyces sp. HU2014]|uniref:Catalase n=1 Tax=Streptomyces albireticuli TaxID=1940 RepID=A0A1Z2L3T2_9ACTN|nr:MULTISPECIES: catalase [Streptomyces]ARZ68928.1 catalase [Streptomyces albireticuli]UQI48828.1 catalase [Streptomyces sp. HU2014]